MKGKHLWELMVEDKPIFGKNQIEITINSSPKEIIFENESYEPESKFDRIVLEVFEQFLINAKEKGLIITGDDNYSRVDSYILRRQSIYSKKGYVSLVVECREGLSNYYTARINSGLTTQKNNLEVMEFKVLPIYKRGHLIKEMDFKDILKKNLEFVLNLEN